MAQGEIFEKAVMAVSGHSLPKAICSGVMGSSRCQTPVARQMAWATGSFAFWPGHWCPRLRCCRTSRRVPWILEAAAGCSGSSRTFRAGRKRPRSPSMPRQALNRCHRLLLSGGKLMGEIFPGRDSLRDMETALEKLYGELHLLRVNGQYVLIPDAK